MKWTFLIFQISSCWWCAFVYRKEPGKIFGFNAEAQSAEEARIKAEKKINNGWTKPTL